MRVHKKKCVATLVMLLLAGICFTGCTKMINDLYGRASNAVGSFLDELETAKGTSKEERIYDEAVNTFFKALDARDANALKEQFSVKVQSETKDLEAQIQRLLEVYQGPTSVIERSGGLGGEYSNHYGDHESLAYDTFPVVSGDEYYWCRFEYMYEFDTDKNQIGITQVLFFTAQDYCYYRYKDDWKYPETKGLMVYADKELDCEVRCVSGYPYKYTAGNVLDESKVKAFLEKNHDYSDFVQCFGEPNAVNIYYIYELPAVDGKPRYLSVGVDESKDAVYGVSVVSDLEWQYTLWENK